ncbi:hypothetical protein V8C42DRAFT_323973 [Trichoderma barbatum]
MQYRRGVVTMYRFTWAFVCPMALGLTPMTGWAMRRPIAAMVFLDVYLPLVHTQSSRRPDRAPTSGRGCVWRMGCSRNRQPKTLCLLVLLRERHCTVYKSTKLKGCRAKQCPVLVLTARLGPHSIRSNGNVTYSYREVDSGLLASPAKAKCTLLRLPAWLVGWCFSHRILASKPREACLLAHGKSPCG